MNAYPPKTPNWTTSAFGTSSETSPMELSALGDHLDICRSPNARLLMLHNVAQRAHGFAVSRLMTTLAVTVLLLGFLIWLI